MAGYGRYRSIGWLPTNSYIYMILEILTYYDIYVINCRIGAWEPSTAFRAACPALVRGATVRVPDPRGTTYKARYRPVVY